MARRESLVRQRAISTEFPGGQGSYDGEIAAEELADSAAALAAGDGLLPFPYVSPANLAKESGQVIPFPRTTVVSRDTPMGSMFPLSIILVGGAASGCVKILRRKTSRPIAYGSDFAKCLALLDSKSL
jgi:hypothetical protein